MSQHDKKDGDKTLQLSKVEDVILPERKAARNAIAIEGESGGREYRSIIYPLDFYIARRYIEPHQYRAGDRLRSIFNRSILRERYVRMNYGDVGGGDVFENTALAPRDYLRAMEAVQGDRVRLIVRNVCCYEVRAGKRGEMILLKSGLDDLARHFKING